MKILDRLPISKDRMSLRFGDRYITAHRNQILVWVSVHLSGVLVPEENIPRFPALMDTSLSLVTGHWSFVALSGGRASQ
jgi:hypothetical protein